MKKKYEAPQTRSIEVELESGFMTGSNHEEIDGGDDLGDISITEQDPGVAIGSGDGYDGGFGTGWDE